MPIDPPPSRRWRRRATGLTATASAVAAWLILGEWPGTEGSLTITPPLEPAQRAYLGAFHASRRVARDPAVLGDVPDPARDAVHLPLGPEAGYFVADVNDETTGSGVIDVNRPALGQPSLYCDWVPTSDGSALEWAGEDSFEAPVEWIAYLDATFLGPWQRQVTGHVDWYTMEGAAVRVEIVKGQAILTELSLAHRARAWTRVLRAIAILGTRRLLGLPLHGG